MTAPDFDGTVALIIAVVRQWADEARRDPDELRALAGWLDIDPAVLRRRLSAPPPPRQKPRTHRPG